MWVLGKSFREGGKCSIQTCLLLTFPSKEVEYCGFCRPRQPEASACVTIGYPWSLVGCPPLSVDVDAGGKGHLEPVCIKEQGLVLYRCSLDIKEALLAQQRRQEATIAAGALLLNTAAGSAC